MAHGGFVEMPMRATHVRGDVPTYQTPPEVHELGHGWQANVSHEAAMHMGASTWQSMPPAAAVAMLAPPHVLGAPIGTGGGHSDHYAPWATCPPPMSQAGFSTGNLLGLPGTRRSGVGVGVGQTAPPMANSMPTPQQQLPYSQMPGTMAHHAVYLQQLANVAAASAGMGLAGGATYPPGSMLPPPGHSSEMNPMMSAFAHTHAQQQQLVEHMARACAASNASHYLGTLLPTPGASAVAPTLAPAADPTAATAAGGRNSPSPMMNMNNSGGDGAVVTQPHPGQAGSLHSSVDTSDDSGGEDDVASAAAAALEAAVKQEQAFAGRSFAKARGSQGSLSNARPSSARTSRSSLGHASRSERSLDERERMLRRRARGSVDAGGSAGNGIASYRQQVSATSRQMRRSESEGDIWKHPAGATGEVAVDSTDQIVVDAASALEEAVARERERAASFTAKSRLSRNNDLTRANSGPAGWTDHRHAASKLGGRRLHGEHGEPRERSHRHSRGAELPIEWESARPEGSSWADKEWSDRQHWEYSGSRLYDSSCSSLQRSATVPLMLPEDLLGGSDFSVSSASDGHHTVGDHSASLINGSVDIPLSAATAEERISTGSESSLMSSVEDATTTAAAATSATWREFTPQRPDSAGAALGNHHSEWERMAASWAAPAPAATSKSATSKSAVSQSERDIGLNLFLEGDEDDFSRLLGELSVQSLLLDATHTV